MSGRVDDDEMELGGPGALLAALEGARTGTMRDIVATIQREQDEIIRSSLPGVMVVQGGPGTGKTAVALHRAAYLLYTHRFPLERQGVLVIGPNPLFLRYIEQVLPSLGESGITLSTIEGLVHAVAVRAEDPPAVARLKGEARMAGLVGRAVRTRQRALRHDAEVPFGAAVLRLPAAATAEIVSAARRRPGTHNARRRFVEQLVVRRLADDYLRVLAAHGMGPDRDPDDDEDELGFDGLGNGAVPAPWAQHPEAGANGRRSGAPRSGARSPATSSTTRADSTWPSSPARCDGPRRWPTCSIACGPGSAPRSCCTTCSGRRPCWPCLARGCSPRPSRAPCVAPELRPGRHPLDRGRPGAHRRGPRAARSSPGPSRGAGRRRRARRRRPTYGHIVVDEAQDLSPMQLRSVSRRSLSGSITVVGDIGQATGPWAPGDWDEVVAHLPGQRPARKVELTVSYRTPAEVVEVAARLLAVTAPGLRPPRPVRRTGVAPRFARVGPGEWPDRWPCWPAS